MEQLREISLLPLFTFLVFFLPKVSFSQDVSSALSWQQTNSELDYPIYKFVSHADNLYAAMYGAGVYKTSDEGENWIACHDGLSNFLARDLVVSGNTLFVGTNRGGVFKSSDDGASWASANDDIVSKDVWSLLAASDRLFAGTSSGLFFTDNDGATWQKATLPKTNAHHQIIFSLGIKGRTIIAGSNSHIYMSEDFGATWEQIDLPTKLDIMTIRVQNDLWLLGTSGEGILFSADGRDWQFWKTPIANKETGNTRSMILADNSLVLGLSGQGVVSVEDGLDGGEQSISNLNTGFTNLATGNPSIRSVGYHQGKLYAGTYKQGIWRYDIPKVDFIPPVANSRRAWQDASVFPNPTTDGTVTLAYELEGNSKTQVELFDAYGKRIALVLPFSEQYKGIHQVNYDMSGLSGGTYYFHLQLGERSITKSIVLMK